MEEENCLPGSCILHVDSCIFHGCDHSNLRKSFEQFGPILCRIMYGNDQRYLEIVLKREELQDNVHCTATEIIFSLMVVVLRDMI